MKFRSIELVPVHDTDVVVFNSFIEKQRFIDLHESFEFITLSHQPNFAYLRKFICVDPSHNGFVLNSSGLTYRQCIDLINHYL